MQKETFRDYRIEGIDERGESIQRVHCPECSPHATTPTKCLTVWVQEGTWSCNKCGWGHGLRLRTPWKPAEQLSGVYPSLSKEKIKKPLVSPENAVFDFFQKRGITRATVEKFKIRLQEGSDVLAFPFIVAGQVVNVKYRGMKPLPDGKKLMWQTEGCPKVFFNIDAMREEVVITEGEIDTMSVDEAGFESVVSVPDGAPNADAKNITVKFSFLEPLIPVLQHIKKVVLACDTDANGRRLTEGLATRLGKNRCYLAKFPEGCKDANDVLVKFGKERLKMCIQTATPYPPSFVKTVDSFEGRIKQLYNDGPPRRLNSGFTEFDRHFLPVPGMVTGVTGVPGSGKSTWLANYLIGLAKNENWKSAFYVPENPDARHQRICSQILLNKPFDPNKYGRMEESEQRMASEFFSDRFFYLHDTERMLPLADIFAGAEYLVKAHGINSLVIDPWNKVQHEDYQNEHKYLGSVLPRVQLVARRLDIHIFVIAHPTKMQKKDEFNWEVPTPYSVSGSANWFNMLDNWITQHRYYKHKDGALTGESTSSSVIWKVKEDWIGSPYYGKLHFNKASQVYSEVEDGKPRQKPEPRPKIVVASAEDEPPF